MLPDVVAPDALLAFMPSDLMAVRIFCQRVEQWECARFGTMPSLLWYKGSSSSRTPLVGVDRQLPLIAG